MKEYIPHKIVTIRPGQKPWVTGELKSLIRNRNRLWRHYKSTQNRQHFLNFKTMRNRVVSLTRRLKTNYIQQLQNELCDPALSTKRWWHLVKQVTGNKITSGIPPLLENGTTVTDSKHKATVFNNYFCSQSRLPPMAANHQLPPLVVKTPDTISNMYFTQQEVAKVLSGLQPGKATGPDQIGNFILKSCAQELANSLCNIFNHSLRSCTYPSAWKRGNVVPVHKKSDRQKKENYRPISLLCNVSKVFEKLIHNNLYQFLNSRGLLTPKNSGFRTGDGTVNQLISIVDKIYEGLDKGCDVRMVFLDLSKAFDKVWHKGLIFKMESLGVSGSLLCFFRHYLSDRFQRVVVNGQSSEYQPVLAGVPFILDLYERYC
jgi:hypothetical protein